ncbi:MAG: sugar phosphate isomerase/epimerase [Clostridia bacterium]|nr:sugar phosphate isomerase/epimerase [Clostridia bacterium]
MKLSIETYVMRESFGDERAIDMIADAGFDAVDYSFYWASPARDMLGDDYADRARAIRAHLDARGIVCSQTHTPFDVPTGSAFDLTNPKFVRLVRSLEASAILGADNAIVHRVKEPEGVEPLDYFRTFYLSLLPYAEKYRIHIAVENLFEGKPSPRYQGVLNKPELLTDFIRSLGSEWFTACVDVGHATITGTAPQDFIAGMDKSLLRALHIQDNDGMYDCHWIPYQGHHDWNAIMKALSDIGYEGDLTMEVFAALNKLPDNLIADALVYTAKIGRELIGKMK